MSRAEHTPQSWILTRIKALVSGSSNLTKQLVTAAAECCKAVMTGDTEHGR
jgi:hypothetical protein